MLVAIARGKERKNGERLHACLLPWLAKPSPAHRPSAHQKILAFWVLGIRVCVLKNKSQRASSANLTMRGCPFRHAKWSGVCPISVTCFNMSPPPPAQFLHVSNCMSSAKDATEE
eukprot:3932725-Rhodomonas_salina.2